MKPKTITDRNYIKLQKLLLKKERRSRKKDFLQIKYSDPGKLLGLIKDLYDSDSIKVQLKVNIYLQTATSANMAFIIEECSRVPEAVVRVIGTRVLTSKIIFQVNNEFIQRLRNTEHPIHFHECFIDPTLLEIVKEILLLSYSKVYKNFLMIPIYHPYRKKVIFYVALINYDSNISSEFYYGIVGECFRYCHEIIMNTMRFEEEKYFHKKFMGILNESLNSISLIDNVSALISEIRSTTLKVFIAERCRIYIVDENKLCTRICEYGQMIDTSDEPIDNIKIPIGVGIAGKVAETGKVHNCTDPKSDPLYRKDHGAETRRESRNILTFPLLVYTGTFGVIQVYDKIAACHFDSADVQFAQYLGPVFGVLLHICLRKKKLWDAINRRSMIDELFLKDCKVTKPDEVNLVINCARKHEYLDFFSYKFLPSGVDPKDVICLILRAFEDYSVLSMFSIDRRNFVKFLIQIRNRHYNYPLHNWQHSFCVFHFVYIVVKNEELLEKEQITPMELLAMFVTSLSRCMESRGSTSPYQPTAGTTLASLYSSPGSLIQYYSIAQLVRIMTSKDCTITDALAVEEYRELIKILDQMFLYMDLADHVSNRVTLSEIARTYDMKNHEHNKALISVLLICSELSDYCKPYEYCNAFSDSSLDEFYASDTKDCTGVIDISGFTENIQMKKVELKIHFMRDICEEAFRLLKDFLPQTQSCHEIVEENSRQFKLRKEAVIQEQMEQF